MFYGPDKFSPLKLGVCDVGGGGGGGGGGGQKNLHNSQKLPQIGCYQAFSNSILIVLLKKTQRALISRVDTDHPIFFVSASWIIIIIIVIIIITIYSI